VDRDATLHSLFERAEGFLSFGEGASFIAVKALQFGNTADDLFVRTPAGRTCFRSVENVQANIANPEKVDLRFSSSSRIGQDPLPNSVTSA
jgi:hypothetical protein